MGYPCAVPVTGEAERHASTHVRMTSYRHSGRPSSISVCSNKKGASQRLNVRINNRVLDPRLSLPPQQRRSPNNMKTTLMFSGQSVSSFSMLPACYDAREFESPARSTVPSIAYWSIPETRIAELAAALQMPAPAECVMEFEHKTAPPKGQGKESHTDLMISWDNVCVGVEAKYTEPHYETVADWIDQGNNTSNRRAVLAGWCDLIKQRTGCDIQPSAIPDLTYQMLHRLASVCARPESRVFILYQVFNPGNDNKNYYRTEMRKLMTAIGSVQNVRFLLSWVAIVPSDDYQHLLAQWEKDKHKCRFDVVAGLVAGSLMHFESPMYEELK